MRNTVLALLLAAGALSGCDSFEPSDALLPLSNASTDPAALQSEYAWLAAAAVSDGKAYEFPAEGFSTSFSADGIVGGDIPNNGYAGYYTASAEGALTTEDIVMTLVSMTERDERLATVLLGELQQATRFEIEGRTLQVLSEDGDGVRFELGLPYQQL
jgi:heat shock protein HslJ